MGRTIVAVAIFLLLSSSIAWGQIDLFPKGLGGFYNAGGMSISADADATSLNKNLATKPITARVENVPPQIISGTLVFTKQVIASDVDETHSVMAADLDGDNDLDVVATGFIDGIMFWYENDGNGGFVTHVLDANLAGAYPSNVADVDRDGDIDVLACGYVADTVVWYENDGSGGFTRRDVDTAADGAHSVVTGDLDEDGDIDLLTTNQDAGTVTWYENDGSLGFTLHLIDAAARGAKRAEFADIDNDDDLDVVAGSNYTDEIAWHENDGNQGFTKRVIDSTVNGAYYVFPADVDGDGDVDVLTASQYDNSIRLYRNDGDGNFAVQILDASAEGARSVIAADVDGDGDLDPISTSVDDDTVGWYENNGDGTFTQRAVDVSADGAYGVFAIDFEHDGDIDVLSASRDADTIALHHQIRSHEAYLTDLGGTLLIDATLLLTLDADDIPAELTYTITDGPDLGELQVDGTVVPVGGTFTQDDIDNNRLTYVHDGSLSFSDIFSFTVADGGEGGFNPASGTFTLFMGDPSLAHWPLDETSGQVAADVVGGYDGTLVGGPVWQPDGGRIGGALEFDGVDDYVDIGAIDFVGENGMTVALWLRPQAFNGDSRLISKATGTAEQDHYWMVSTYLDTRLRFRLKAGGGTSTLFTGQNVLDIGEWYHVACTYDQNEMRIYGNGTLVASMPKTGVIDMNPAVTAAIGAQPPGAGSNAFAGTIDDVRLFLVALNEPEIADLAEPIIPTGLDPDGDEITFESISDRHALHTNVPNPFNPSTMISYDLSHDTDATLEIFDVRGRRICRLVSGHHEAGQNFVVWHGRDTRGTQVSAGVYFVLLRTPEFAESIKITLVE
jgi:hypothetical protein